MRKKLLSILALLCLTVSGAWAQTYTWSGSTLSDFMAYQGAGGVEHYNNTNIGGSRINVTWSGGNYGDGWMNTTINAHGSGWTLTFEYQGTDKVISSIVINASMINGEELSSGWSPNDSYLTWSGTPSKTVTLSGESLNVSDMSSVVITLCPIVTANSDGAGNYWATYYNSTTSFTADANTTVYKAAMNGTSSLTLTEVANREIPSGKAVILKSSSATITLTPVASTTADLSDNVLLGGTSVTAGYDAYTLSRGSAGTGAVGFYKFSGALDGSKAHLEILSSSPAPARGFFGFGDDGTTAIEAPTATIIVEDGEIYDLMGRRIEGQPTRKGIYVKNGQKFIVK